MKIIELIEKLAEKLGEFGNVEVCHSARDEELPVESVSVEEDDATGTKRVQIQ